MNRRSLLKQSSALGAGFAISAVRAAETPETRKLKVAVVALGRGIGRRIETGGGVPLDGARHAGHRAHREACRAGLVRY